MNTDASTSTACGNCMQTAARALMVEFDHDNAQGSMGLSEISCTGLGSPL